jgi:hypothetical protein
MVCTFHVATGRARGVAGALGPASVQLRPQTVVFAVLSTGGPAYLEETGCVVSAGGGSRVRQSDGELRRNELAGSALPPRRPMRDGCQAGALGHGRLC